MLSGVALPAAAACLATSATVERQAATSSHLASRAAGALADARMPPRPAPALRTALPARMRDTNESAGASAPGRAIAAAARRKRGRRAWGGFAVVMAARRGFHAGAPSQASASASAACAAAMGFGLEPLARPALLGRDFLPPDRGLAAAGCGEEAKNREAAAGRMLGLPSVLFGSPRARPAPGELAMPLHVRTRAIGAWGSADRAAAAPDGSRSTGVAGCPTEASGLGRPRGNRRIGARGQRHDAACNQRLQRERSGCRTGLQPFVFVRTAWPAKCLLLQGLCQVCHCCCGCCASLCRAGRASASEPGSPGESGMWGWLAHAQQRAVGTTVLQEPETCVSRPTECNCLRQSGIPAENCDAARCQRGGTPGHERREDRQHSPCQAAPAFLPCERRNAPASLGAPQERGNAHASRSLPRWR